MNKFIEGKISKVLYEGNNGYLVGILRVHKSNDEDMDDYVKKTITFTYTGLPLNKEFSYRLYGSLIEHPRFGMQYNVINAEIIEPDSEEGLIMYLSSGLFYGIGEKTASSIVKKLGVDAIKLIREDKTNLNGIKGLSKKKAELLYEQILNQNAAQELVLYLTELGFTTKESLNLATKYNMNIYKILENNIYRLVEDIDFLKLDGIYLKNNEETTEIRIKALIEYIIKNLCYKTGNTLVEKESVYLNICKFFSERLDLDRFNYYLSLLNKEGKLYIKEDFVTLTDYYRTEKYISDRIKFLNMIDNKDIKDTHINRYIDEAESSRGISFDKLQKEAIINSIKNNFFIITGGPGTGKTTIIRTIVDIYKNEVDRKLGSNYTYSKAQIEKSKIVLLAPTGRSAKRMMESVSHPASTIHKFLKWNKETQEFGLNEDNQSEAKIVIVDEASMIDIFLFKALLNALKEDVKIILIGDEFQLPSIGPGNILGDLLASSNINKTYLNKIYRTDKNSYIPSLAELIKCKDDFINDRKYSDFSFIESVDYNIKENLRIIVESYKKKQLNVDDLQILAPMYKGENGIDNLNKLMQELINPYEEDKDEVKYGNLIYRENDKVLQLINDVDNNVFNGDIGYINKIYRRDKEDIIEVDFMGNMVEYKKDDWSSFTHGYVISVHKSQGSEYDNVVIILSEAHRRMFYNKLIYTAVTRAKKTLLIIGKENSMNVSINSDYADSRITSLYNLINE